MAQKKVTKEIKSENEELASEWDFSEGFGGIPENVSLTKNIGCASDSKPNPKKTSKNSSSTE
ncbi:hypothetical protein M3O96_07545 [Aquiflexum sp. TKW24L]|uniref:hypothetical protein n=1 Tax=Aquiflexum sp. TKW24L TaxID=2942212 RepID=UPI0020BE120E|nr:hypothetical protein [Aquiflexum sp. TKW24L]MCL6258933.1 hypothetical protein [Aquiflexum sp. TKW24L]